MRWSLLFLFVLTLLAAGCRSSEREPVQDAGVRSQQPVENDPPPTNSEPEPEAETDEVCLLPPEARDQDLAGKIKVGQQAPDFVIGKDAEGNDVRLSDHRGKTVLLFFWATWCPYCKISLKQRGSMNSLGVEVRGTEDAQLVIVGIGTGTDDSAARQEVFMQTNEVPWQTIHDEGSEVEGLYGVLGVPTCVVVGREGKILTYGFYRNKGYQEPLIEYLRQECISNSIYK